MSSTPALLIHSNGSNSATIPSSGLESGYASSVLVHPMVLLSVLDHHTRRQEGAGRVIGTLLGRRDGDKVRPIVFFVCQMCDYFLFALLISNNADKHEKGSEKLI